MICREISIHLFYKKENQRRCLFEIVQSNVRKSEVFRNVIGYTVTKELGINDWVASLTILMPAVPTMVITSARVDLSLLKLVSFSKII